MEKKAMETLVQSQLEAYNRRDVDSFCKCFHPEVQVTMLVSGAVTMSGMEKFRSSYEAMFESSPELHCNIKSRIVLDSAVIDEEFVTGRGNNPDGIHVVAIYAFRDGLIDRVWFPR